jgi:hypothetical protein
MLAARPADFFFALRHEMDPLNGFYFVDSAQRNNDVVDLLELAASCSVAYAMNHVLVEGLSIMLEAFFKNIPSLEHSYHLCRESSAACCNLLSGL